MRIFFIVFWSMIFINCSGKQNVLDGLKKEKSLNYLYVYIPDDLDLVLTINENNSFQIKDHFGSQGMFQKGKWFLDDDNLVLIADTSNMQIMKYTSGTYSIYKNDEGYYNKMDISLFPPLYTDTIKVIDRNELFFRGLVFHSIDEEYSIDKKIEITREYYREKLKDSIDDVFAGDSSAYFNYIEELIEGIIFYHP